MSKKRLVLFSILAIMLMMVGCKPSEEKLKEAEDARNLLIETRTVAEERYLDIADTSLRPELDQLGVQVEEIVAMDFAKMSDKKLDEVIPTITSITESYGVVQSKLDGTYKEETTANEEKAKNLEIDCYIINKMGFDLNSVVLHDITTDTYSDNLLGDDNILVAGYTLMGIKLEVHTDSEAWELIVKNTDDTSFTLPCESLKDVDNKGVSLSLEYDNDAQSGSVTLGGYFSN